MQKPEIGLEYPIMEWNELEFIRITKKDLEWPKIAKNGLKGPGMA